MSTSLTIVEPLHNDLIIWFENARPSDQCDVVTEDGETYTHLTKFNPTMVKWQLSGFTGQDSDLTSTLAFMELLQAWKDITVGQAC